MTTKEVKLERKKNEAFNLTQKIQKSMQPFWVGKFV